MVPSRRFEDLVAIMDRLRGPDGCPWDREQTYESLRGFLLEECHEAAESIDRGDPSGLREELGDLLFQIVFLSRLAKEDGRFDAGDVVLGISEKMIRRHPHVFGDDRADTAGEVLRKWEEIKRSEKGGTPSLRNASLLDGVPPSLPALLKAQRLGDKAARVGFDWPDSLGALSKVEEEAGEVRAALSEGDARRVRDELGDLLFAVAMLARKTGVDAEGALEGANRKFKERFSRVEECLRERGIEVSSAGLEVLDRVWNQVKAEADGRP